MAAGIGYIALVLALAASVYSVVACLAGRGDRHPTLVRSGRYGAAAVYGLVSVAVVALLYALIRHDFSIAYVAAYTSRDMSLPYLLTALWAGNDGSLLFWTWLLSLFAAVAVLQKRSSGIDLVTYATPAIMLIVMFFLALLLTVSNPFLCQSPAPADGAGLNPMLENIGMILHPPLILAGYVVLTVPFAFAVAALVMGRLGNGWLRAVRGWMLWAWLLLGAGNLIGAWWAYVELGWGGYWGWDPVENAGLMPWLLATAFLHSAVMQRRRGTFQAWNMVLVILTFNLAIFGTFITRSGVLSSVHAYAESGLGLPFLAFLVITLIVPLVMLFIRRRQLREDKGRETPVAREGTFLMNNILLVGAALAILLGTILPAISGAIGGARMSVGPSFYNQVAGPVFLAVILLAGICTLIGWHRPSGRGLAYRLIWPLVAALLLGVVLFIAGIREWPALVAFSVCGFTLFAVLYGFFQGGRGKAKGLRGIFTAGRTRYGSLIVHLAVICIAVGVVGSSFYSVEEEAVLNPGEAVTFHGYTLTYAGLDIREAGSKLVVATPLTVSREGRRLDELASEKYYHRSYPRAVTEVAIRTTLAHDLYVIPVSWEEDGTAAFRMLINPLVVWIWIGGGLLILGGLIVFWPGARRSSVAEGDELEGDG